MAKSPCCPIPRMLRAEDTVRLPGDRIAPMARSWALRQVLGSNRRSKGSSRVTMTAGRVGILDLLW